VGGEDRGHPPLLIGQVEPSFVANLRLSAAGVACGGALSTAQPNCAAILPLMSSDQAAAATAGGAELNARLDGLGRNISQQLEAMRSEMRPLLVAKCTIYICTVCIARAVDAMYACGPTKLWPLVGNGRPAEGAPWHTWFG
jgi:hypothetical protein